MGASGGSSNGVASGWTLLGNVLRPTNSGHNVGIGTDSPNAKLDVRGIPGAIVGGFASGSFHVTSPSALVNANAVITGHNSFGGNKQLWYFGSTSSSNDNIALINRQNAALSLNTNNLVRLTVSPEGNVGIGTGAPAISAKLELSTTTGALLISRMATSQRDALDAREGMIIYNTTTDTFQGRVAAGWVTL